MKFAQVYQKALQEQFPVEWQASAVPYKQLKKVIKKVARELNEIGLDAAKLNELEGHYKYGFDGKYITFLEDLSTLLILGTRHCHCWFEFLASNRPRLTIIYENDLVVDATISPDTVSAIKALAELHGIELDPQLTEVLSNGDDDDNESDQESGLPSRKSSRSSDIPVVRRLEVPLSSKFSKSMNNAIGCQNLLRCLCNYEIILGEEQSSIFSRYVGQ